MLHTYVHDQFKRRLHRLCFITMTSFFNEYFGTKRFVHPRPTKRSMVAWDENKCPTRPTGLASQHGSLSRCVPARPTAAAPNRRTHGRAAPESCRRRRRKPSNCKSYENELDAPPCRGTGTFCTVCCHRPNQTTTRVCRRNRSVNDPPKDAPPNWTSIWHWISISFST